MRQASQPELDEVGQGRTRETETRARILDAGIECFSQFGNDKTTLNDVARVAGLARQTIYRYFPDRASLLEAVDAHEAERLAAQAARIANESGSLETFLERLIEHRIGVNKSYRVRQHLAAHDRGLFQSMFLSRERNVERIRDLVTPQVTRASERGELRGDVEVTEASEWIAINLASLATLTRASSFDLDDPAAVGRFVARHLCRGLVTDREQPAADRRAVTPAAAAVTERNR